MSRTSHSPTDVLGISLGVLVILMAIGSFIGIVQGRMFTGGFHFPQGRMFWDMGRAPWWGNDRDDARHGNSVREEKDEQVPSGDITEVEVRTIAGSIDIAGAPAGGSAAVHSVKTAPFPAAMDGVRVDIEKQGSRLIVQEQHDSRFMGHAATVSFRISIPAGVKVVEAHSVSGSLAVHDVPAGIDQTLGTISGSVATTRARNLDVSTTSGGIRFVSEGALNAHSVSGSINGTIAALPQAGSAQLNTISGSVSVGAFSGLDARLTLHSLSGRVSCGFPVTISEQKNNRLEGRVGTGAAVVDIGTMSGSIDLSKN
jgi:hypothetical protein